MGPEFFLEVGPNMLAFLSLIGFAAIIYAGLRGFAHILAAQVEAGEE